MTLSVVVDTSAGSSNSYRYTSGIYFFIQLNYWNSLSFQELYSDCQEIGDRYTRHRHTLRLYQAISGFQLLFDSYYYFQTLKILSFLTLSGGQTKESGNEKVVQTIGFVSRRYNIFFKES